LGQSCAADHQRSNRSALYPAFLPRMVVGLSLRESRFRLGDSNT
jgi:hypothetical protein